MAPFEAYEARIRLLEGQRAALVSACNELAERLYTWIESCQEEYVLDDKAAIEAGDAAIRAAQPEKEVK